MMTYEMMMTMVEELGEDATYYFDEEDMELDVTLRDFDGFDEDYCEVMRDFDHPELVDAFLDTLSAECVSAEGDFYREYHFDGFTVRLGYSSFDI